MSICMETALLHHRGGDLPRGNVTRQEDQVVGKEEDDDAKGGGRDSVGLISWGLTPI